MAFSVKIDMSKAYDRIEWRFLKEMLLRLGYNARWTSLVMNCVETVSYQVKINGQLSDIIRPSRGLRQGDPISPYLFILSQEWLSTKLHILQQSRKILGISLSRGTQKLNHLFFADDCLFFLHAELRQLMEIKALLHLYETTAGQKVNLDKSEFVASPNLESIYVHLCSNLLGMAWTTSHSKYLGLPLLKGGRRTESFKEIEDKMMKKIQSTSSMFLSWAGREIMLKACLQPIPVYFMSCFKIPKSICNNLNSLLFRFWWGSGSLERKVHWIRKETLLKKKVEGGLGFRSLESFNNAMLMKQLWRIINNPDSMLSCTLKDKYSRNGDLLNCRSKPSDSSTWKSLCGVMRMFRAGLEVSNGGSGWRWKDSPSGEYSVKLGYDKAFSWEMASSSCGETSTADGFKNVCSRLWGTKLPNSIILVSWRLLHNTLPTADNLRRKGCAYQLECAFCRFRGEDAMHIFVTCWWAISFWSRLGIHLISDSENGNIIDWVWKLLTTQDHDTIRRGVAAIWVIWKNRNEIAHGKKGWSLDQCAFKTESILLNSTRRALTSLVQSQDALLGSNDLPVFHCDGAWDHRSGYGGFAAVGIMGKTVIGCVADHTSLCGSALHAELMGMVAGFDMAEALGF